MARPRKPWYRADRDWWMVEIRGRQHKLCRGRDNRDTAEQKFHALMAEMLANPAPGNGEPTVGSIIEAFLNHASRHDAASTFYERQLYLQKFANIHGGLLVRDCIPFHLTSWIDAHPTWKSSWTRSYAIRTVKRPFNWALQQGLLSKNPFATVAHSCGQPRRPLSGDEFRKLLRAAGRSSRVGEVLQFAALTGCRPCEIRKLCWPEVDFDQKMIVLREHKTSHTQQTHQPRIIPLVPAVIRLLKSIKRRNEDADFVFVTRRRKPWARSSLQQAVRRLRRKLGIPESAKLYGLRHRFGTESVKAGNDIKTTAILMGHTTTRMTEHYLHLAGQTEHLSAAMARVAKSV